MKKSIIILMALSLWSCKTDIEKDVVKAIEVQAKAVSDTLSMSHDEIMKAIEIKQHNIKTIGILVYDGVNSLDVFGPKYVLNQIMGVDLKLIALKPGHVRTVMGVEFVPNTTIAEVDSLDILVIPGGFKGTIDAAKDKKLHDWIIKIDKTTTYTSSVCTGGWILGSTGLLKGKKATTNWFKAEEMLASYGAIFINERFTKDGKYWTAAGVTAGMDMALAMLAEIAGKDYAQGVMLDMEYDPSPPFKGGSPEKTSPEVLQFMTTMYEAGVNDAMRKD